MSGEPVITVIGNLTADPELRFTPSGSAVANFTIASTPRTFDRQADEWKDGETLFLRSSIWRDAAENVAESFTKGMRVIAQGRLKSRSFETKEGEKRTVYELDADEVGPSMKYAQAKVRKIDRRADSGGGYGGPGAGAGGWGAPSGGAPAGGQGGGYGPPAGGGQGGFGGPGASQAGGQGGFGGPGGGDWGAPAGGGSATAPLSEDPWATGGQSEEPPF